MLKEQGLTFTATLPLETGRLEPVQKPQIELISAPPNFPSLIEQEWSRLSVEGRNLLNPIKSIKFTSKEGKSASFNTLTEDGREIVFRTIYRVFENYDSQGANLDWGNLINQVKDEERENIFSNFKPLREETLAQLELAQLLTSESNRQSINNFLKAAKGFFESQEGITFISKM